MPEDMSFLSRAELLTYEEMFRIVSLLVPAGISKLRITGGEPLLRKDIMQLFRSLSGISGLKKIALTTNGTHTLRYLDELMELGVRSINLSIDSLDQERFFAISKRDLFQPVIACLQEMMTRDLDLRLNCVVMKDQNIDDIIPMVELGQDTAIAVRFIEEMPFNGHGGYYEKLEWDHQRILTHITARYPDFQKLPDPPNSTSLNYQVTGFKGTFGIIPAYTRSFCGSCNRIRLTAPGILKTCLYQQSQLSIRDIMRSGVSDEELLQTFQHAISNKALNGFEAEKANPTHISESMSLIGG